MPRSASPYLQRLSAILNRKLQGILRSERDKARALEKASVVFQAHFGLVIDYAQRRLPRNLTKLSPNERDEAINKHVTQALKDFEKILDDR